MSRILTPCPEVWGNVELRDKLPETGVHANVIYVPYEGDAAWGIFGRDGVAVDESMDRHGPEADTRQVSHWEGTAEDEGAEDAYIYAGLFNPHYGHFLVNCLSRLWPLAMTERPVARLLFHGVGSPDDWFELPFVREIFGSLRLAPSDMSVFCRPTKIATLIVPRSSFQEQHFIHRIYAALGHRIGASLLRDWRPRAGLPPVYLSKRGLTAGVGRIINEAPLEKRLQDAGVEIVRPEALSLRDQAALFAERPSVIGTLGSGFHSSIFVPPRARLLLLSPIPGPNSNFLLVDAANGNTAEYLYAVGTEVVQSARNRFLTSFRLPDPVGIADALLRHLGMQPHPNVIGASAEVEPQHSGVSGPAHQPILDMQDEHRDPGSRPIPYSGREVSTRDAEAASHSQVGWCAMIKRSEVIQGLLSLFEHPSYLEVGVFAGETFFEVKATRKVAVDPQFLFSVADAEVEHTGSEFFETSSDDYFGNIADINQKFHVIYLDGLHTLEQTLRDFTNSLEFLHRKGIIVIDDILPRTYFGSLKTMERAFRLRDYLGETDGAWMGDTYRLAYFIDSFFQQYSMRTVSNNEGQLIVWKSRRPHITERLVEEVGRLPFEEVVFQESYLRKMPFAEILAEIRSDPQR